MRHPTGSQVSVVPVFETWADFDEAINRLLIGFRGTNKNYAELAGNPLDSSLFVAAITVVGNCIIEPDLQVRRLTSRLQDDQIVEDHELVKLWNRPNAFYDGRTMLKALITSLIISDNAFLIKERNVDGKVIELWYESHETIGPRYPKDGSKFISHYEQDRGSEKIRRSVEDVIHFRNGLNPMNPRVGLGTSGAILREVYADNESANWYANLMANDAAFRYFLTIDNKAGELGQEDIENIKKLLIAQVSGDNKFKAPVITNAEPKKIQFSPEELDLRAQRYGAEERFAASKGIPPEVMELGAGKQHSIYNNVRQAQERFTENYLCPLWGHIGHTLDNQLLPEFSDDPKEFVAFDMSQVRALQEDEKDKHKRIADDYLAGVISRFEARQALGYQPEETDKVYFVPRGGAVVPVGQVPVVMRSNEGQDANMRTSADTIEAVSSTQ